MKFLESYDIILHDSSINDKFLNLKKRQRRYYGGGKMRKPVVDYRSFRLSKINEPQFKHLQYLLGWVGYFILFFLTTSFEVFSLSEAPLSIFS